MNIFCIPSWYPNPTNPLNGIFTKEQIRALADHYPEHNFLVSLWGQLDTRYMWWWNQPIQNFKKFLDHSPDRNAIVEQPLPNLTSIFHPTFTWTRKLAQGNIKGILQANEKALLYFAQQNTLPDLIHAHVAYPAGHIARMLSEKFSIPYLITEHMSPFPLPSFGTKGKTWHFIQKAITKADEVIAVSDAAANEIEKLSGRNPIVIPNVINEEVFSPASKSTASDSFTFLTIGRMEVQKGIPDLLKAIKILNKPHVRFNIAGNGSMLKRYQEYAHELGISQKITWLGELSREQVSQAFNSCQAFVLPSLHESMGVVYIEALAMGKPVIATRNGGAESIVNNLNGILTAPGNPQKLAVAMDFMIKNYAHFNPEEIKKDFHARFSCATTLPKLIECYQKIVHNNL